MTIETSARPVASKSAEAADPKGRKPTGQAGAGADTGFMALLAGVDDAGSISTALPVQDEVSNEALAPVDSAQSATDLIAFSLLTPCRPTLDMALQMQTGARGAGQSAGGAEDLAVGIGTVVAGLKAPAARVELPLARAAAASTATAMDATAMQAMAVGTPASGKEAATGKLQLLGDKQALTGGADSTRFQDAKFMASLEAVKVSQGVGIGQGEPLLAPGNTAGVILERPTSERAHLRERDAEGVYTVQSSTQGLTSYAVTAVSDSTGVTPSMDGAQEVSYWISQDVKNAELKLDGLGKDAVEVSISMHGNEAHVAFRTDELQARTLLEGAAAHLKAALQGEGLVLSGVSVGTSGGGRDPGDNERKQRQGTRQTVALQVAGAEARRTQVGAAGRTLDLFV